ncbi:hypothetical protein MKZ12_07055 [Paenibacillus sp. FSL R5-0713]|uniref:hypothetical protein n=1 Tax=Paenibacillus sp. FSL R5-0713 TaxID=2921655 RepID=UPI0030D93F11
MSWSWDWLYLLYSIAAMILVFSFLWKIVEKIVIVIIALLFNERAGIAIANVLSLLPHYLFAAFTAFTVLGVGEGEVKWHLALIGGLFLFFNEIWGVVLAKKEAEKNYDFSTYKALNFKYWVILIEMIFFVYVLYDPRPAVNSLTQGIANIIDWVQDIPFLNWLIAAAAFVYAIYITLIAIASILGSIASLFTSNKNSIDQ